MDAPLASADQEMLAQVLLAAFPGRDGVEALNLVVKAPLGFDLFTELGGGTIAIADIAGRLIARAEADGTTTAMVMALFVARPGDGLLRLWVQRCRPALLPQVPDAAYQQALVTSATDGLEALRQVAASRADVRATLAAAHINLVKVPDEIGRLALYKGLHDVLHKVQVPLYRSIFEDLKGFPTDPACGSALADYAVQLTMLSADAQSVLDDGGLDAGTAAIEQGWITTLGSAADRLGAAAAANDKPGAFAQAMALKAILRAQPPRLDALLVAAARAIPFADLIETMILVAGTLPDGPRKLALSEAVIALTQLGDDVTTRAAEHESWQQIEASFWITEDAIGRDDEMSLMEFSALWPALESQIGQVCTRSMGDWVGNLQTSAQAFLSLCPQPVAPPVAVGARAAFARYVGVGRLRFYLLDKDLKSRCDRVTGLSRPLSDLLQGMRS